MSRRNAAPPPSARSAAAYIPPLPHPSWRATLAGRPPGPADGSLDAAAFWARLGL